MIPRNTKSIVSEFRSSRNQTTATPPRTEPRKKRQTGNSPYESFLAKYRDLENTIDDLKTRDLVYYFREIAEENGHRYVIANIQKDMAIMKRLRQNYSNREICGMIEFLYESDQDYLDKNRLSPNLLASNWVNTIYADTQLWVDDKYVPKSKKQKKTRKFDDREWNSDKKEDNDNSVVSNDW